MASLAPMTPLANCAKMQAPVLQPEKTKDSHCVDVSAATGSTDATPCVGMLMIDYYIPLIGVDRRCSFYGKHPDHSFCGIISMA